MCENTKVYDVEVNLSDFAQNVQEVSFGVWIDCAKPAEKFL